MVDDNRWSDRDRDWRDDRRWQERERGRGGGYGAYGGGGQQSYYGSSGRGGRERWEEMHRDRSHEGPAGYNDSGPVQGGWSFGDREQGGERGQGYDRYGYGRGGEERSFAQRERVGGPGAGYGAQGGREYGRGGDMGRHSFDQSMSGGGGGRQDYAYGNYTPFGYRGSNEWDQRGNAVSGSREPQRYERDNEGRSWMERAGERMASFFGAGEEGRHDRSHHMGEHRGRGPKGYRRSDERVREDVNDRLSDDPWLDASNIEVEVKSCEVTLTGTVMSREDKRRAETIAESVSAVSHVQNNLRVDQNQQWSGQGSSTTSSSMGATTGSNPTTGTSSVVGDIAQGKTRGNS